MFLVILGYYEVLNTSMKLVFRADNLILFVMSCNYMY